MSTALHGHRGIIDSSLGIGSHSSVLESPEFDAGDRRADGGGEAAAAEECGSSESSSIGKNSDASLDGDDDGEEENEVQSSYRGPLEMMDSLEEVLPFR